MSLQQQLLDDMKTAMRDKEKLKLSVIRMTRAAIKNAEIEQRKELDDDRVLEIIAKEVKMRRDSIVEYEKAGRDDIVDQLHSEIGILTKYLPEQLTRDEVASIVEEAIQQVGAQSPKDMGRVMGAIMPKVKGRADGKLINELVRQKLSDLEQ